MKKGFSIMPPPKDRPPVFRVIYVIDVGAGNVVEAAKCAYAMMTDSDSIPPILEVMDDQGNKVRIDMSERLGKDRPCVRKSAKSSKKS
ncbi:MAG TPA: hypothetical protein PKB02_14665 [Anaerohalosphaeraceae bacterium]|nr:hypothetical protein [Anaerohalosphaeraceae bacterium]